MHVQIVLYVADGKDRHIDGQTTDECIMFTTMDAAGVIKHKIL